jgi:hypothetical protein
MIIDVIAMKCPDLLRLLAAHLRTPRTLARAE